MQIKKSSTNKNIIKLSKSEWLKIGKTAGWIKTSQEDKIQELLSQMPAEERKKIEEIAGKISRKIENLPDPNEDMISESLTSYRMNKFSQANPLFGDEITSVIRQLLASHLSVSDLWELSKLLGFQIVNNPYVTFALGLVISRLGASKLKKLNNWLIKTKNKMTNDTTLKPGNGVPKTKVPKNLKGKPFTSPKSNASDFEESTYSPDGTVHRGKPKVKK